MTAQFIAELQAHLDRLIAGCPTCGGCGATQELCSDIFACGDECKNPSPKLIPCVTGPCPTCAKWRELKVKYFWHEVDDSKLKDSVVSGKKAFIKCSCMNAWITYDWWMKKGYDKIHFNPTFTVESLRTLMEDGLDEWSRFCKTRYNYHERLRGSHWYDFISEFTNPELLMQSIASFWRE